MAILKLNLDNGRMIRLREYYQRETYADMLIGSPNRRLNEFIVNSLESRAKEKLGHIPVITVMPTVDDNSEDVELPRFLCMGRFDSIVPSADGGATRTELIVCWFEEAVGIHMSCGSRKAIQGIDWEAHCCEQSDWD